ncbi:hypothetical protein [Draconibacterium halophilum]|uniref:Uncharacterized protein n=1 Tax=Draconibacterium halophilum TaxID=2706887 RepID=A0A6C0R9V3_9BACT|nr:hypothetical protein [Draconibacterium halophilum]QIA07204.1 hypothetical protein G0Q07_05460 [Draconibacterium halophilum]
MEITKTGKILFITAIILACTLVIFGSLIDIEKMSDQTAKILSSAGYGIIVLVLVWASFKTSKQK